MEEISLYQRYKSIKANLVSYAKIRGSTGINYSQAFQCIQLSAVMADMRWLICPVMSYNTTVIHITGFSLVSRNMHISSPTQARTCASLPCALPLQATAVPLCHKCTRGSGVRSNGKDVSGNFCCVFLFIGQVTTLALISTSQRLKLTLN